MAKLVDIDTPSYGYFYSFEPSEVIEYVINVLEAQQECFTFLLHTSAYFTKDDDTQELHLVPQTGIIFDPQMPEDMVREIAYEKVCLSQEPEAFEAITGSGWSIIPKTIRFWFKLYPCQPGNDANPNRNNTSDHDSDNYHGDDKDDTPEGRPREWNYFLYSVVEYFARKKDYTIPRQKFLKFKMLEKFCIDENMGIPLGDFEIKIKMQDLAEYHRDLNMLNIRVFSLRGNCLYAKRLSPTVEDYIDLYLNSNNCFGLVLNLWSLFKKNYSREFCMNCLRWGQVEKHTCGKILTTSKRDTVDLPILPEHRHALVAYADFEAYIVNKTDHRISGWGCVLVDLEGNIYDSHKENLYTEKYIIKSFIEYLTRMSIEYSSEGEESDFCPLCGGEIDSEDEKGSYIVGRNFITGESGTHHEKCWMVPNNTLYVFFHNFRGYDSHFLIKDLVANTNVIRITASNMEKMNCIVIEGWNTKFERAYDQPYLRLTFKDTFNFFSTSLANCVKMVQDWRFTPEKYRHSKGVFPYDWFDDRKKLEYRGLPPQPWHNNLTGELQESDEAFKVWEEEKFTFFHEYHDFYMMLDVMQIADVFEEFRRTCYGQFSIDPVHFQGAPGLTWHLGVLRNQEMFKIIQEKEVYMDIQNNIRGGVSQAMVRYINIEKRPENSLFFLDVNSLYSKCMTYKLPGKYLGKIDTLPENWQELWNQNTDKTAILVVDLHYPAHLHDRDWAYPLAPHKFNDRLCTTFHDKEKYMIHAELLSFYLSRGMIIIQFHYGYEFEQDYALREYVDDNILKRRQTQSEVMKSLYKLLNNSLYGKTCENVHKYRKFDTIVDDSETQGELGKPRNKGLDMAYNIIECGPNYLVEKPVKEVKLNKPIQIGFSILEFAKREIYNFIAITQDYFNTDKEFNVVPVYTDTDSLLFYCGFQEPWKHFYNSPLRPLLDFERAPEEWGVKTHDTDKVSGLWSPEAGGKEIIEYVGLRAKAYCYRFRDNNVVIKNKGVPKSAMIAEQPEEPRDKITIEHYRNALFTGMEYYTTQYAIRSNKHEVQTEVVYKLSLSADDLKRSVTANRVYTLPYGYQGEYFFDVTNDFEDFDLLSCHGPKYCH